MDGWMNGMIFQGCNGICDRTDITLNTNNKTQLLLLQGVTALMWAAFHGYDSLIVMLLSANADGNLKAEVSVCICCCMC